MSLFKFKQVQVYQEMNRVLVYFDRSYGRKPCFQFSSNKGYVDFADLWLTQALLKGIIANGYKD